MKSELEADHVEVAVDCDVGQRITASRQGGHGFGLGSMDLSSPPSQISNAGYFLIHANFKWGSIETLL